MSDIQFQKLPSGWKAIKTKYVADLYTGNSISHTEKDNYTDAENAHPYIATKHVDADLNTVDYDNGLYVKNDDNSFRVASYGSTLMCIEGGSAGRKKAFIDRDVSFVNKLCCFRPNELIDGKYLYYCLMSPSYEEQFRTRITGLIGGVSVSELKNLYLCGPQPMEQQAIAAYLDERCAKIDELIAEAAANIAEYKELKQAVIFEAVTKGLDKSVPLKDSGVEWIGKIPKNWELRKLKTFTDMISKGTTPSDMSNAKSELYCVRYLKSENIKNNELSDTPEFYITKDTDDSLSRSKLRVNDILFVIAGASIGKVAVMKPDMLPANTNQANSFLRLKQEFFDSMEYLWFILQSNIVTEVINRFTVKSAQPNISMENLGNIRVPFPVKQEERELICNCLHHRIGDIDALISEKQALIDDLQAYKKSLIYEAVTGKRRVG